MFYLFRKIDLLFSNTVLILVYIFLYQIILHNYNTTSTLIESKEFDSPESTFIIQTTYH